MNTLVAYIDDSEENLKSWALALKHELSLETFIDPHHFVTTLKKDPWESILIDVHMPMLDGHTLYKIIKAHPDYNGCPVFFVSADLSDETRMGSFKLGAADHLDRTMRPEEIKARIASKIGFHHRLNNVIEHGMLKMDLKEFRVTLEGAVLPLTFIELKILALVLQRESEIVSKEELARAIWDAPRPVEGPVYTHLSNLNQKLRAWDHEVHSIKGKGIKLVRKV